MTLVLEILRVVRNWLSPVESIGIGLLHVVRPSIRIFRFKIKPMDSFPRHVGSELAAVFDTLRWRLDNDDIILPWILLTLIRPKSRFP